MPGIQVDRLRDHNHLHLYHHLSCYRRSQGQLFLQVEPAAASAAEHLQACELDNDQATAYQLEAVVYSCSSTFELNHHFEVINHQD